ncbi:transposase (plasmid) [Piscirickettsia salmonis]|uniref:Transposase n=1 Tax=Piscirickettsia salmonis TaxID=1238 RepID=A0AAC8ZQ37_PISSA|nr:transposase [Piscirickettsia salmonis]
MECAASRHVTLCDADSRGFIVVAFCSAILHHWMCKIPTEVATLTYVILKNRISVPKTSSLINYLDWRLHSKAANTRK